VFSSKYNCVFSLTAPSAPPESLNAWNLSSTRLYVQWGQVPARERNGKILGYFVEIKPDQGKQGRRNPTTNFTASRSLTFSGLSKYSKYVISVCALTWRRKGPSRTLTVRTDEDGKESFSETRARVRNVWN